MEAGGHLPRSFSGQEPSQAMGELMKGGGPVGRAEVLTAQ